MRKEKIKVLEIAPMEAPKICYLEPTRKAFQKAINMGASNKGKAEAKKLGKQIYAIFNKDRFLANLTPNRRIGDDIIAGMMYVVAVNENKVPVSLTEKQIKEYALRFWSIEAFDDMDVAEANINTLLSRLWKDE